MSGVFDVQYIQVNRHEAQTKNSHCNPIVDSNFRQARYTYLCKATFPDYLAKFQLPKVAMTSSFSISASVKVRAFCSFLGENTSTSAMYVAVTGLWSENLSSVLPYLSNLIPVPYERIRSHLKGNCKFYKEKSFYIKKDFTNNKGALNTPY